MSNHQSIRKCQSPIYMHVSNHQSICKCHRASLVAQFACNTGDPGSIPGLGRSPGEGHSNPLQYSCLDNPMFTGA